MKVFIKALHYYLPIDTLSNEDINKMHPEWHIDKIMAKTGINNRHISGKNEFASDMAIKVAEQLFENSSIKPDSIDFILYCTQSPDYILPSSACIIQDKLGIPKSAGALDFNLGCSGYIYGLALAKGLISAGVAKNILFITSETYSKYIQFSDKSNKTIFGDGSSATIISNDGFAEILDFSLGTDGSGAKNLIIEEGGSRFPRNYENKNEIENNKSFLYMNGPEIFSFTSKAVPKLVYDTLLKNNYEIENIDLFVFHQANKYMLEHLRKKIEIDKNNFYIHIEDCGNTVSSTIPIALKEAITNNRISNNMNILLAGFGVGYSWGGVILKF